MSEGTNKLVYIDVARGLALLVIIVSHACGMTMYLMAPAVQVFFDLRLSVPSGKILPGARGAQCKTFARAVFWV